MRTSTRSDVRLVLTGLINRARMTLTRSLLIAVALLPGVAAAQTPPPDIPEEQIAIFVCVRDALLERGFTEGELSDLFGGRIENPEAFVTGRIGEDGIRAIAEACFPESGLGPAPTATPPDEGEIVLTPEQRACVTQYIDAELLDRILRREVRPEEILSPEQLQEIGRACFGLEATPPPDAGVPPTIDLSPDVIACLKDAIGETAFGDISSGRRQPTPEEAADGQRCFPHEAPGRPAGPRIELTPEQRQCVSGIIGADTLARILNGQLRPEEVLTQEQMRRVGETCFGGTTGGSAPPPGAGGPPPEVVACVERVLGEARTQQLLRGGQPTPDEMRRVEAAGCFPRGQGSGGGPGRGSVSEIPPEIRACLEGLFGAERVADFLAGRTQPTQEEINRAQTCVGGARGGPTPTAPYPTPNQEQCVNQCTAYERPDGGRFSADECRRMCAGEPVPASPPPQPSGSPGAGPGLEQCVQNCKTYEGGRYNVGNFCERACRGEPVQPPDSSPPPTSEPITPPPEPAPYPTPNTAQCVASCTGYTETRGDGTTHTYTADECQSLCSGGVQGAAVERDQGGSWWVQLLGVIGL